MSLQSAVPTRIPRGPACTGNRGTHGRRALRALFASEIVGEPRRWPWRRSVEKAGVGRRRHEGWPEPHRELRAFAVASVQDESESATYAVGRLISTPVFCPQFVGRLPELAFLIERRRDLANSHGGIVLVGGDAGVGKSRLVREFLNGTGQSRGRVAVGRCRPFGNAPYGPLAELLAKLFPASAPVTPAQTQEAQLQSIADAFLTVAAKHAIVGIIEDLHWADSGTLAVLALLAERIATSRILLVATYRANELEPAHQHYVAFGALLRGRSVTSLALAPLGAHDIRYFIDVTLRNARCDVPRELRRTVAQIAEGNPFFTEELLRAVVDREGSQQASQSLPTTIHAAIVERMRPFAEADRAILTQAAVIGRRFEAGLLAHTLDADITAVLSVLQRARALQIVEETGAPAEFRFRHALTREAIYDRLLAAQRGPLHRRIALALEARAATASADALAYHWWAAGDRAKALEYGERGGDAAAAVHGYDDSIACYERTLSLLDPSDRDAARVQAKMATCYFRAGVMERAIDHYRRAWAFYETPAGQPTAQCAGATSEEAEALFRLARSLAAALYNDGRRRDGIAFLARALDTIAAHGDRRVTERARLTFAAYLADSAAIGQTRAVLSEIDAERISDDTGMTIVFWQTTCRVHALEGDVAGVRAAADRICAIGEHRADAFALIEGLAEAGISALIVGETTVARRCLGLAIDTCVALELTASHGDLLVESALERTLCGAYDEARSLIVRALPMIGEGELGRGRAALAALAVGTALDDRFLLDHEPDAAFIERVFAIDFPLIYGPLAASCAQVFAARGEHDAARAILRRAVRAATIAVPLHSSFPLVIVASQLCARADAAGVRELCAASASGGPAALAAADLARAILANRFGDGPSCAEAARRAAAGFAAFGWPLYEALAIEAAGDVSSAQRIRERIGYAGKPVERAYSPVDSIDRMLTPRELEIARLVAGGGTNREIAAALNVSVKLVEKHLSSVFAKLALTSRSQLTAHIVTGDVERRRQTG